jgi:BlaI family transcriptional regulator, penicillinase repressor
MSSRGKVLPRPTPAETAILRALWTLGPATVRQVHERLSAASSKPIGYTTVLKTLQIMTDKRLVTRDSSARSHVYTPALAEEQTQHSIVRDLIDRVFGGSAKTLVLRALGSGETSPEELAEIRKAIDQLRKDAK